MKSYPKVWFLRHGETEWNAEGRVQGQTESVLSERGKVHAQQQAELMAPILAHNPPCIVSPLKRTRQTADIALGGRDYQTDDRLKEIFAGDWEGHLFQARVNAFVDTLTEPTVVVAHGLSGQLLRGALCGLSRAELGQLSNRQGCVYVLENGQETVLSVD